MSILDDVKHALGLFPGDNAFDRDITMFINGEFSTLCQMGVGPRDGYMLVSGSEEWTAFFSDARLNSVMSYVILAVRLKFDPPQAGYLVTALENQIRELQFRINVTADYEPTAVNNT